MTARITIAEPNGGAEIAELVLDAVEFAGSEIRLRGAATGELAAVLGSGYMQRHFDLITEDGRITNCVIVGSGGGVMRIRVPLKSDGARASMASRASRSRF